MRLLFFWRHKHSPDIPQVDDFYNFSDKCRFEIVSCENTGKILQLNVIRNSRENAIPDDFFHINGKKSNISQINAIVGKNGAGKSTLLKRIAFASLQPYENDAGAEICIIAVDFGSLIKIYYYDYHNIANQQQRNISLIITEETRQCLSELFGCDSQNILLINTDSKDNQTQAINDFTTYLVSNNDDYLGDSEHSRIEKEYYDDEYVQEGKKERYSEYAAQITNQAVDYWGEKYYKKLCCKDLYRSDVIDAFLEPVYSQCVKKKEVYNWLYLDFILRYFISNDNNINNSDMFGFYSAGKTLFSLFGIGRFCRFIHDDNELKKYIKFLIHADKIQGREELHSKESLPEERAVKWKQVNKNTVLEGGFAKIQEICGKTGYDNYKNVQRLYIEIVFNELQENLKSRQFKKITISRSMSWIY